MTAVPTSWTMLGYDPAWVERIRVQAARALEELRWLHSSDPEAIDALHTLDDVRRFLESDLIGAAVRMMASRVLHTAVGTAPVGGVANGPLAVALLDGGAVRFDELRNHDLPDVLERLDEHVGDALWSTAASLPRDATIADLDLTGLEALAHALAVHIQTDPNLADELLARPQLWSVLAILIPLAHFDDDVVVALAERLISAPFARPHDDPALAWLLAHGRGGMGLRERLAPLLVTLPESGVVDWNDVSNDELLDAARLVRSATPSEGRHGATDVAALTTFARRLSVEVDDDDRLRAALLAQADRPEMAVIIGLADFPADFVAAYVRRAVTVWDETQSAVDRGPLESLLEAVADDVDLAKDFIDDTALVAHLARRDYAPEFADTLTAISMLGFLIRDADDLEGSIQLLDRIVEFSSDHPTADLSDVVLDSVAFGFQWHAWHLTVDNRLQTPADGVDIKITADHAIDLGEHDDLTRLYGQVAASSARQRALADVVDHLGDVVASEFAMTLRDPTATRSDVTPDRALTATELGQRLRTGLRNVVALEQLVLDNSVRMEMDRRCGNAATKARHRRHFWTAVGWATSIVPVSAAGQSVLGALEAINGDSGARQLERTAETSVSFNGDTRATALVAALSSPRLLEALGVQHLAAEHPDRWAVLVEVAHRRNRGDAASVRSTSGNFLATDIDDALAALPGTAPISEFLEAADVEATTHQHAPQGCAQ